jgi:hypothetical protein
MKVIEFPKDTGDQEQIVEQIEGLLQMAKDGHIESYVFVGLTDEDSVFSSASASNMLELLGMLELGKQSVYLP